MFAKPKIQHDKCESLIKEVAYLGHLITKDGVKPNPSKFEVVEHFPQPKTIKIINHF